MSAVASTSDLSKQPKQGSKAKSTASKSKAKDPLGYGYNHLAGNTLIAGFVDNAVQKKLTSFRHFGEVVRNLPFKSALLDEPRPLEEAVGDYAGLFEAGLVGKLNWERITTAAKNVSAWERATFTKAWVGSKSKPYVRARKTLVRKLRLVDGDVALHGPLALADQAEYFSAWGSDLQARWISTYIMFIAFDALAAQALPQSLRPTSCPPGSQPYQRVLLDANVVNGFNSMLWDYQDLTSQWISTVTTKTVGSRKNGIFGMIKHGYGEALVGTTMCNIGSAALVLRNTLKNAHVEGSEIEFLVEKMSVEIKRQAKDEGMSLPDDFFSADKKSAANKQSDCCIAFLCAMLISPLTLLTGQKLYGKDTAMKSLWPFMIWQQIAHLQRPEWVTRRERELMDLLIRIAWAKKDDDVWAWVVGLAEKWKREDRANPPNPQEAEFFRGRVTAREDKKKLENQKKRDQKKRRSKGGQAASASESESESENETADRAVEGPEEELQHEEYKSEDGKGNSSGESSEDEGNLEGHEQVQEDASLKNNAESGGEQPEARDSIIVQEMLQDEDKDPEPSTDIDPESTPSHIPAFSPRLDSPSRSDTDSDAAPSPPRASSLRTPTPGSETEPIHGPGAEEDFPMDNDEDSDRNAGDLLAMNSDPAVSPPPRSSTTPSPSLGLARAPRRYHSRYSNVKRGLFTTPSLMWNDPDGRIRREDEEEGDEDEEEGAGRQGPFLSTSEAGGSRTPTPQMEGVVYSAAEDNFAGFEQASPAGSPYNDEPMNTEEEGLTPRSTPDPDRSIVVRHNEAAGTLPTLVIRNLKRKRNEVSRNEQGLSGELGRDAGEGSRDKTAGAKSSSDSQEEEIRSPPRKRHNPEKGKILADEESDAESTHPLAPAPAPAPTTANDPKGKGKAKASGSTGSAADKKGKNKADPQPQPLMRKGSRKPSAQPSVTVKTEVVLVPLTHTQARTRIRKTWNMKGWKSHQIASDIEEFEPPAVGTSTKKRSKPVLDWAKSFVVRALAFGGSGKTVNAQPQRQASAVPSSSAVADTRQSQPAEDVVMDDTISKPETSVGAPAGGQRDTETVLNDVEQEKALHQDEEDEDGEYVLDDTVPVHPSGVGPSSKDIEKDGNGQEEEENSDEGAAEEDEDAVGESEERALEDEEEEESEHTEDQDSEPNPTDSDREYKRDIDTDDDIDPLPEDAVPPQPGVAPLKLVNDDDADDDLRATLLYDVRVALPKTVKWRGRQLLKTIDSDARALNIPNDTKWLETYSLEEWNTRTLDDIEKTMSLGHCIIVRDTNLNQGWDFDMRSAYRIRSGTNPVEVQEFKNRHRGTGVQNEHYPLRDVVHPDHRDPNKVLNLLNAPQSTPLVQIPRQSDFDFGSMALKARMEAIMAGDQGAERGLDFNIQRGLNWGIISQMNSMTLGHVDTAGVYTAIVILAGIKYWAIRKTVLEGRTEIDVDDAEYFVDLNERDLKDLPGGATDWVPILLFPGDMLIIPPNARHAVYTISNSMMAGIHFYYHSQLPRSLCGWICSRFTSFEITNAEHNEFLSIFQAFGTFYAPAFDKHARAFLDANDPVLRTQPHPESPNGLPVLAAIAASIVFNDALSGVRKPYRGLYLMADRQSFRSIWATVTKKGYVEVSDLNFRKEHYAETLAQYVPKGEAWDNRWTCAGLGLVLVHVARAIVYLSYLWEAKREKSREEQRQKAQAEKVRQMAEKRGMEVDSDEINAPAAGPSGHAKEVLDALNNVDNYLAPETVYGRVILDVSNALGIAEGVAKVLIDGVPQDPEPLDDLSITKIFPTMNWIKHDARRSARPAGLWDAFFDATAPSDDIVWPLAKPVKTESLEEPIDEGDLADQEDQSEDEEEEEEYGTPRKARKAKAKPKVNRKKPQTKRAKK